MCYFFNTFILQAISFLFWPVIMHCLQHMCQINVQLNNQHQRPSACAGSDWALNELAPITMRLILHRDHSHNHKQHVWHYKHFIHLWISENYCQIIVRLWELSGFENYPAMRIPRLWAFWFISVSFKYGGPTSDWRNTVTWLVDDNICCVFPRQKLTGMLKPVILENFPYLLIFASVSTITCDVRQLFS